VVVCFTVGENWSTLGKPQTCRKSLTNFFTYCCIEYTSSWAGFKLTTLVVISTVCTVSCESYYHISHSKGTLDIWSSKGRTFTGPNHFLLNHKKLTQFRCNILFSCIFIYVSPVFNFITPIFTKVIIIIIFAIFCMS
jgi:hypothetical protein